MLANGGRAWFDAAGQIHLEGSARAYMAGEAQDLTEFLQAEALAAGTNTTTSEAPRVTGGLTLPLDCGHRQPRSST